LVAVVVVGLVMQQIAVVVVAVAQEDLEQLALKQLLLDKYLQ